MRKYNFFRRENIMFLMWNRLYAESKKEHEWLRFHTQPRWRGKMKQVNVTYISSGEGVGIKEECWTLSIYHFSLFLA